MASQTRQQRSAKSVALQQLLSGRSTYISHPAAAVDNELSDDDEQDSDISDAIPEGLPLHGNDEGK